MKKVNVEVEVGVETVRLSLEAWRGRRRRGERIPEAVWGRAVEAAQQYGVFRVSRALGLDYNHLKRRTREGEAAAITPARFMELPEGLAEVGRGREGGNGMAMLQTPISSADPDAPHLRDTTLAK